MNICYECNKPKPATEFTIKHGKRLNLCKACQAKRTKMSKQRFKERGYRVLERTATDTQLAPIKCYENLANAVVEQAVEDYRWLHTKERLYDGVHGDIDSLKDFFRSEHFGIFTSVDGEMILRMLDKELGVDE